MRQRFIKIVFMMSILAGIIAMVFGCANPKEEYVTASSPPAVEKMNTPYNLDFVYMHNLVVDEAKNYQLGFDNMGQSVGFFYVLNHDISGDNEKREIILTTTCMDGTALDEVDLFLSFALIRIGEEAAEEDYRFKRPTIDKDGTTLDFGSVFNEYDVVIKVTTEDGTVLRDDHIKAGSKIPIDSRYWSD